LRGIVLLIYARWATASRLLLRTHMPQLAVGCTIEARYRIGRRLGKGACGVVHAARSLPSALADHGRVHVAVKILASHLIGDPDATARFTHEAFLGSRLPHPNLVRAIDFGQLSPGRPYFVMERCHGVSLDRLLAELVSLPRALALPYIVDVAQALAALHAHGIVHRDVKASNIFCTMRGRRPRARLVDLGVAGVFDARLAHRLLGAVDVGASGNYGTPTTLAPEQALGLPTDARTDVYALACVAYRALTGIDPFRGENVERTICAHLFGEVRPASAINPALPARVDEVLDRALAREPALRTPTALRFAAELSAALD
jgi:serine/threonine-protein kinase